MKKALPLLIALSLFLLCACSIFPAKEADIGFFNDAFLAQCKLTGMPTPDAEDIRHDENTVYCNMTEQERVKYADEMASYLIAKEDIYYKGYHCETGCAGGIFYLPEYRFAPLTADANYGGWFAFSLTEQLNEYNESNCSYTNGVTVSITIENGKIGSYSYNTVIEIDDDPNCIVYQTTEHEHTGKWFRNDIIHFYEYTCGCANNDIAMLHLDGDGNGLCDICSYQMVAEGNHFMRNQAGYEWLNDITADEIFEIKMIWGGGGPLPPVSKTHISSSRNKDVISSIFEEYYWLDSKPVDEGRTQIADGGYTVVQFILNNGETKQLYFINGDFYQDDNDNYFEIVRLPVFRDGTDFVTRYGFEQQYNPFQIHLIDGTPVCGIPFSEFEFTELTDTIYLGDELPTHYFEIRGERVYFIRGEYFYIGDDRRVYYQLIGNLDNLIAEYSATTTD